MALSLLLLWATGVASLPTGGVFPKETFKSYSLSVGTKLGTWDVIEGDLPRPQYNPNNEVLSADSEGALTQIPGKTLLSQFWVAHNSMSTEAKYFLQKPVTSVEEVRNSDEFAETVVSDMLEARVVSWGKAALKNIPKVDDTKNDMDIAIEFSCHKEGRFKVSVNMRVFEMLDPPKEGKTFKDLKFGFIKECSKVEKVVKGTGLADFYVGTSADLKDVVNNGETTKPYLIREDDANQASLTTVEGSEFFTTFYMRFEEPSEQTIKKKKESFIVNDPIVSVDDPAVLAVETLGELAYGGTVDGTGRPLILKFICLKEGTSSVSIEIQSPDFPDFMSLFSFNKICDVKGHSEGIPISGLNIGTKSGSGLSDVVKSGITKKAYRNAQEAGSSHVPVIIEDEKQSTFYLSLSDSDEAPSRVKFMRPILVNGQSIATKHKVVEPQITGGITKASSISSDGELSVKIKYNCLREGMADVSVEIPIRPKGSLQFMIRKVCNGADTAVEKEEIKIKGLNMGTTKGSSNMIEDGLTSESFQWTDSVDDLKKVPKSREYLDFFLSVDSKKDKTFRIGTPELISSLDIFYPEFHGHGSGGGLVSKSSGNHFTITFHCLSNGTSLVTVAIPLLGVDEDDDPPREDPLVVTFLKECPTSNLRARAEPRLGGVYMKGFAIDYDGGSANIVRNGFPTKEYFGQRKKKNPDWEDAIIPKDQESVSLKIYYCSDYGVTAGDKVEIGKPSVVPHHSMAKPSLSGSAAAGGKLELDGDPLVLDVTFNCQFEGMAAISIVIPIEPHGSVTFTIPKTCDGADHPGRVKISGMHVEVLTEENRMQDVVVDGIAQDAFSPFIDEEENFIVFYDANTTFFIERKGSPIKAMDPIVFCHRSWCMPEVVHEIPRPNGDKAVSKNAEDPSVPASIEIELVSGNKYKITVIYHCIYGGQSPVSVSIPVLPMGTVSWTWTVVCPETGSWFDDDFLYSMGYSTSFDDLYSGYSTFNSAYTSYNALYSGDDFFYNMDMYYDDDLYLGSMLEDDYYLFDELTGYSLFTGVDYSIYSSYINVGTGITDGNMKDVVQSGIPQPQWELACKEEKICKVYGQDVKSATFYFSLENGGEEAIDAPIVKATNNKQDKMIVKPALSGKLVDSYDMIGTSVYDLQIEFNCKSPGVSVVHVALPLLPAGAMQKQVAFSFLKICGGFTKKEDFSWTATRGMNLGVVLVVFAVLAGPYCYFKKKSSKYSRLPQANRASSMEMGETMDLPDDDSIDSESD